MAARQATMVAASGARRVDLRGEWTCFYGATLCLTLGIIIGIVIGGGTAVGATAASSCCYGSNFHYCPA